MKKRSKSYKDKLSLVDRTKGYVLDEALALLKQTLRSKFVESVDLSVRLISGQKKGSPLIRGSVILPGGSGKTKKVAVITSVDKVAEAESAGADVSGSEDLIEKINKGFMGFDILLASPEMMPKIGRLGKTLGTRGLMPNPKTGTVTADIAKTVKEFKSGKIEFKADKTGVINLSIGKSSFEDAKLKDNFWAVLSAVSKVKPSGTKGDFIKRVSLSSTMGPGIHISAKLVKDHLGAE